MSRPKNRFALLLAAVVALVVCPAALAQRGGAALVPIPEALLNRLNLTDEQKAKLKAAAEAYQTEQSKIRNLSTPQERRQATRKAREDYQAAVKAALTPEQQQQLEKLLAEARQYAVLGPMGAQLVAVNLTDEQKSKIKEIMAKYQPEIEKLQASLNNAPDRAAVQRQITEQRRKAMEEVRGVLTPEQLRQLRPARQQQNQ